MAQTIQIKRGTGSAIPTNLADGELAINLDSGQLYYGSGSTSLSHFRFKDITAERYIVSSSVTNLITQTSSGSTVFGNSGGDKHSFIGNMVVTGSITIDENNFISSSGDIISSQTITMQTASIGGGIFTSASLASAVATDLSAYAQINNVVTNSTTASFVTNSDTASFVTNSDTASFVTNSQTGSFLTSVPINTSGLESLKVNASLKTGSLTVGPAARQIELRGGSTFTSTNPRILSSTGIIEVDDAIQMNSQAIYFHEGATNSYIAVDFFTPDNLEIHANQDLELIPDDNLIISSSTSAKTIHYNELQVIGDVNASGNILFNNISGGTF